MKKLIAFVLSLTFVLTLVGCGFIVREQQLMYKAADQSTTTSEHGGTEKVSPCFAYSIAFLRNIWYNINNLKDFAAVTISTLATVWQQKIR